MFAIGETGARAGEGDDVHRVPLLRSAQFVDDRFARNAIAGAHSCHRVDFRERSRDDEIRRGGRERDHAFVVGAVDVVVIRLVDEDDRRRRRGGDEFADALFRRDRARRIVRIADVDDVGVAHLVEIVRERRIERHFHDLGPIVLRVVTDRFECRIGHRESLSCSSVCGRDNAKDVARSVAEENFVGGDVVKTGDVGAKRRRQFIRISRRLLQRLGHRMHRAGRRSVWIFVRAEANDSCRGCRCGGAREARQCGERGSRGDGLSERATCDSVVLHDAIVRARFSRRDSSPSVRLGMAVVRNSARRFVFVRRNRRIQRCQKRNAAML